MRQLPAAVDRIEFSPDRKHLVVRTHAGFHVLDVSRGDVLESYSRSKTVWSVAFSPDAAWVVTGGEDMRVRVFDTTTGNLLRELSGPRDEIDAVMISPDKAYVCAHSMDGVFWRWGARDGDVHRWREADFPVPIPVPEMPATPRVPAPAPAPPPPSVDPQAASPPSNRRTPPPASSEGWAVDDAVIGGTTDFVSAPDPETPSAPPAPSDAPEHAAAGAFEAADASDMRTRTLFDLTTAVAPWRAVSNNGRWIGANGESLGVFDVFGQKRRQVELRPMDEGRESLLAISNDGELLLVDRAEVGPLLVGQPIENQFHLELRTTDPVRRIRELQTGEREVLMGEISGDNRWVLTCASPSQLELWAVADGKRRTGYEGLDEQITAIRFSSDAGLVAAGSTLGGVVVWDRATGKEVQRCTGHTSAITCLAFSPDGKTLLTGSADETVRRWDLRTGRTLTQYEPGGPPAVAEMAFAPDGRKLMARKNGEVLVQRTVGDDAPRRFVAAPRGMRMTACVFSSDGKRAVTASAGDVDPIQESDIGEGLLFLGFSVGKTTMTAWNTARGAEASADSPLVAPVHVAALDAKQKELVTIHSQGQAARWKGDAVAIGRAPKDGGELTVALAVAPDLQSAIVIPRSFAWPEMWDVARGVSRYRLPRSAFYWLESLCDDAPGHHQVFSPDSRLLFVVEQNDGVVLDAGTGRTVCRLQGHQEPILDWAFSPDGTTIATAGADGKVMIWDSRSGALQHALAGHTAEVLSVVYGPTSDWVASGGADGTARIWQIASEKETLRIRVPLPQPDGPAAGPAPPVEQGPAPQLKTPAGSPPADSDQPGPSDPAYVSQVPYLCLSPDGRSILTRSSGPPNTHFGNACCVWDTRTGKRLASLELPDTWYSPNVTFSPDARWILGWGNCDEQAAIWNAATGKVAQILHGHVPGIRAAGFMQGGRLLFTCSGDGRTRLWDVGTGKELCTLIAFTNGTWAVIDPYGRYDASNGGDIEGLHWVIGNEPVDLTQLKDRYYDPGLLAKILGSNTEPLRKVDAFRDPKLYPEVELAAATPDNPRLGVRLKNRGGGIGRVVVLVNGKERTADARGTAADPNAAELSLEVDLSGDPHLKPGEENVIDVYAYNAEGYLRSRDVRILYTPSGNATQVRPHLWAVVAGVSDYRGDAIDLLYAAKDALDFATAVRTAGIRLFGEDRVQLTLLTTDWNDPAIQPTRANLEEAFQRIAAEARPDDLLVIYLAGHGVNFGGQDGDYYFLAADAAAANLSDPEVRRQTAISSSELTEWIKRAPPLKQVMILDTCASGRLVEKMTEKRQVPSSQIRALERMKDRTGLHVLAGCAADRASYEASRYAQGLLTYSLLLGMRGAALREEEFVDVGRLFDFAADHVPDLAKDIGGVQRPVVARPRGGQGFDIGRVTSEDKRKIPLQTVRPLVLRAMFQDDVRIRDHMDLTKLVNNELRDCSSRARSAPLVFVDAEEMPGACEVAGRYRVKGDEVTVRVIAVWEEKEISFEVAGKKAGLSKLAAEIVRQLEQRLRQ